MDLLKFKALADETRLRLISILSHYELSVNELVQILGMGQSRVSRHLKILTEAQLLQYRRDGLWIFYTTPSAGANADFIGALLPYLPATPVFQADLAEGARILAERARRTQQFFNAIADNWDDLNKEVLGKFDLAGKLLEAMPCACEVAVDLGCGTGTLLPRLAGRARKVIGVDGSPAMLDLCRTRLENRESCPTPISLRIGDIAHLPLADKEANFACINLVLHHLPNPQAAFAEIRRILAPDGVLFIADFLKHNDETMRVRYGDQWLGFTLEELERQLEPENFARVQAQTWPVGRNLSLILMTARAL